MQEELIYAFSGATGETLVPAKIKLPFEVGLTEVARVGRKAVSNSFCMLS